MPACHAGGRGFESRRVRQYGGVAQLGEHLPCKQDVAGSIPVTSTICRSSIIGSAAPL